MKRHSIRCSEKYFENFLKADAHNWELQRNQDRGCLTQGLERYKAIREGKSTRLVQGIRVGYKLMKTFPWNVAFPESLRAFEWGILKRILK